MKFEFTMSEWTTLIQVLGNAQGAFEALSLCTEELTNDQKERLTSLVVRIGDCTNMLIDKVPE